MTKSIDTSKTIVGQFHGVRLFRRISDHSLKAIQLHEPFTVKTSKDTTHGAAGDYLCEDIDGEIWILKREDFEKTYEGGV